VGVGISIDWSAYPNCARGYQYAQDVADGKITVSRYIYGCVERFLSDLEEEKYPFDWQRAERFLRLVQKFEHVIGDWPEKKIKYEPWQCFVWMNIVGFLNPITGFNRFRIAHIEIARGNAKSTMSSLAALYYLALDSKSGNQIAGVATKKDQARIVLDAARAMAMRCKPYIKNTGVKVQAHSIIQPATNSSMVALSSDHSGLDGLNLRLAILDELHAMRRDTFDVIYSGMSKRLDSLTLCITTAGFNTDSVGYSQSQYAKKVALGEVTDDQFFSAVFCIDELDDPFDESVWIKANPNWGVSVDSLTFKAKAEKSKNTPADLPNFKVKHLNMWLSEAQAFYDPAKWDLCADVNLKIEDFRGMKCRVGVDIASRVDLTSIAYLFVKDGIYNFFDYSYVPEQTVKEVHSVLYDDCIAKGALIKTTGEAINQDQIRDQIVANSKLYKIEEVCCDPWNALHLMQQLQQKRVPTVEFRMTTANLSEATKTLDELIRKGLVRHNGSPLLRWCISNVVCKIDANDNVFPRKSHERLKIDPVIAMLMALASQIQEERKSSIYQNEARGLRII
jgi:phage terminase large subunit-like protein